MKVLIFTFIIHMWQLLLLPCNLLDNPRPLPQRKNIIIIKTPPKPKEKRWGGESYNPIVFCCWIPVCLHCLLWGKLPLPEVAIVYMQLIQGSTLTGSSHLAGIVIVVVVIVVVIVVIGCNQQSIWSHGQLCPKQEFRICLLFPQGFCLSGGALCADVLLNL